MPPPDPEASDDSLHMRGDSCRWHDPSCSDPKIRVKEIRGEAAPYCETCRSAPLVQDIIQLQASSGGPSAQPEDQPLGELGLWWPKSVPYHSPPARPGTSEPPPPDALAEQAESPKTRGEDQPPKSQKGTLDSSSGAVIYAARLAPYEFRLLCLAAVSDESSPVHVTLETYADGDCPEYEAISYTWGGEGGDNRLRKPIFIGPYWDILPQTENCWAMLRFMRPRRGIRLIWVDALCINQQDLVERGNQVAKMAQIYRECTRVTVYLGPDAAPVLHDRFPRRRGLNTLDQGTLTWLLMRRYFSRLWVVQELILSPRAVIRFGDVDLTVEPITLNYLAASLPVWYWERSSAPWVQHTAKQMFQVGDLCEALQLVSGSQSTDPRDRLFGILSLLSARHADPQLRADYSLSNQEVWIGFFAHCLLRQDIKWFLHNSAGIQAQGPVPSWVPDWNSAETWKQFGRPNVGLLKAANAIRRRDPQRNVDIGSTYTFIFQPQVAPVSYFEKPWHHQASICPKTGALLDVRLERLFAIPSIPVRVQEPETGESLDVGGYPIFAFPGTVLTLFLASKKALDEITHPQRDHLFLLHAGKKILALILREYGPATTTEVVPRNSSPKHPWPCLVHAPKTARFRLVAACPYLVLENGDSQHNNNMGRPFVQDVTDQHGKSIFGFYGISCRSWRPKKTVYSVIEQYRSDLDRSNVFYFQSFFGGEYLFLNASAREAYEANRLRGWDFLPLFLELARSRLSKSSKVEEAYLSLLEPSFLPRIAGQYVEISIEPAGWSVIRDIIKKQVKTAEAGNPAALDTWEWRLKDGEWKEFIESPPRNRSLLGAAQTVQFRKLMAQILAGFQEYQDMVAPLCLLLEVSGSPESCTLEDLIPMIQHPNEEYHYWQVEEALEEFTVDGSSYLVDIY